MYKRLAFLIILFTMTLLANSQNKTNSNAALFIQTSQQITSLRIAFRDKAAQLPDTLYRNYDSMLINIQFQLSKLNSSLNSNENDKLLNSDLYKQMSNYSDLFFYANRSKNLDSLGQIINYVRTDLNLKFSSGYASEASDKTGRVSVTVRVFKKGTNTQLSGYYPFVKPNWSFNPVQIEPINPTNHAVIKILPGKKLFYLMDGDKILDQRVVDIFLGDNDPVDFYVN